LQLLFSELEIQTASFAPSLEITRQDEQGKTDDYPTVSQFAAAHQY
jgi:hypothetical protein